jgi:hypothetical protein
VPGYCLTAVHDLYLPHPFDTTETLLFQPQINKSWQQLHLSRATVKQGFLEYSNKFAEQ